jgi:molybdopterin/thiamine biosynthesis adenylyltransferase
MMSDYLKSDDNQANVYKPEFFRLNDESSKLSLNTLLSENPHISVTNEIEGQVSELIRSRFPRGLKKQDFDLQMETILNGVPLDYYGVWVFYPWVNKMVHILDKPEFIELRTNRNQNKITKEEQELLSQKTIGIIGLSVGQSIALTLTMERGCGELRIADFDTLELSNYNRIRTPLYNLGQEKVIATAREIAEIDPFIKVRIFKEGITSENMNKFMLHDGGIDILVDECDGLDMKIEAREFARAHKIPVIMDTSDRGMLDVERFDLEPERPIFHGRVEGIDSSKLKGLTNEQKIPVVLQILGFEQLSDRAKSSLQQVNKTISTWPQLATSVILGGAVGADICRRVLLNQFSKSGRYYMDIEKIINE